MLTKRGKDIWKQAQIITVALMVQKGNILRMVGEAIDFDKMED